MLIGIIFIVLLMHVILDFLGSTNDCPGKNSVYLPVSLVKVQNHSLIEESLTIFCLGVARTTNVNAERTTMECQKWACFTHAHFCTKVKPHVPTTHLQSDFIFLPVYIVLEWFQLFHWSIQKGSGL